MPRPKPGTTKTIVDRLSQMIGGEHGYDYAYMQDSAHMVDLSPNVLNTPSDPVRRHLQMLFAPDDGEDDPTQPFRGMASTSPLRYRCQLMMANILLQKGKFLPLSANLLPPKSTPGSTKQSAISSPTAAACCSSPRCTLYRLSTHKATSSPQSPSLSFLSPPSLG